MNKWLFSLLMGTYIVALMGLMLWVSHHVPWTYAHNDFYDYWIAGKLMAAGEPIYGITDAFISIKDAYSLSFHWATGYSYPPLLAFLFQPISLVPPVVAAWGWFGINCLLYGWIVWQLTQKYRRWWVILYMLAFVPAIGSITAGQTNVVVLIGLYGWLYGKGVWQRAGGLALAGMIKVYPLLLSVIDLWRRQWRMVAVLGGMLLVSIIVPLIVAGPASTKAFVELLPTLSGDTDGYYTQQSINAVISRLTSNHEKTDSMLPDYFFTYLMNGVVLLMLGWLGFQTISSNVSFEVSAYRWIAGLTLMAGRMTFWNFLPTLFGQLWLMSIWSSLTRWQRWGLIIGIFCSTLGWGITYAAFAFLPVNTLVERVVYTLLTSTGFLYGIIQLGLLMRLPQEK